jgi:hypothetical protein
MHSDRTFSVIALDNGGRPFKVGTGLSYFQAETICRRLSTWCVFSDVFVKREPVPARNAYPHGDFPVARTLLRFPWPPLSGQT